MDEKQMKEELEWFMWQCSFEIPKESPFLDANYPIAPDRDDKIRFFGIALDLAREKLAELENGGWQPIATAPRDGTIIDVWWDGVRLTNIRWAFDDDETDEANWWTHDNWLNNIDRLIDCGYSKKGPSNWRPLPEPPKGEQS